MRLVPEAPAPDRGFTISGKPTVAAKARAPARSSALVDCAQGTPACLSAAFIVGLSRQSQAVLTLVPGMPVTVRVATGGGVAFVQLGVERIESTGAWAHARLRASAVLSVDGERRFSRCRYAGTVWLGGRRAGAAEGEVVDLSAVGIRFRTASRLDPDDELELALEVPGQQPISMRAQILRMRPMDDGRSEVAAEVTALESDDWARLERLLAS